MDSNSWSERASAKAIIGKPLSDFICDDVTRMYVATMIESVRVIPHTSFRPYRCDTLDTKRFMQMIITPDNNGLIRISHELLRTEPLTRPVTFKTTINDSKIWLVKNNHAVHFVRCSVCNRLHRFGHDEDAWHEADYYITTHNYSLTESMKVIYSICPECLNNQR